MKIKMLNLIVPIIIVSFLIGCVSDDMKSDGTPVVKAAKVLELQARSAIISGLLVQEGASHIQEAGICWSKQFYPTTSDNKVVATIDGAIFQAEINGLDEATVYYVRAYATNERGTSYSDQISLTTQVVDMQLVKGGEFIMGNSIDEDKPDESPAHQVVLDDFYIGITEITQKQWNAVMDENPSSNTTGDYERLPVDKVSWYNALVFCNKLSIKEGFTPCYSIQNSTDPDDWGEVPNPPSGTDPVWDLVQCNWRANGYRLPTEAEWEYAAGGGATIKTLYPGTDDLALLGDYAWIKSNSPTEQDGTTTKTSYVKTKLPNILGLYDMAGNVVEWCWDCAGPYSEEKQHNPKGAEVTEPGNVRRIYRGGSHGWEFYWTTWRSHNRAKSMSPQVGFRIARNK